MIYNVLFVIVGIGLIALGLSLMKLDRFTNSWVIEVLRHTKLLNDIDHKRFEDSCRLARAFERVKALEDRLEGQEALVANLEEKIKALEDTVEYLEGKL